MRENPLDVIVIGSGQAGLAAGYHLKRASFEFLLLEAAARVGDSWRKRYRSLTLFTPRAFSQLPGFALSGDPDYLEAYASTLSLPVSTRSHVVRLSREDDGFLLLLADERELRARQVIVATGGFQKPLRPALSAGFADDVVQLDPQSYRGPEDVPPGRLLVVGDGASGRDIAAELAATHETLLAAGKPRKLFPERILGRSVWWWLKNLGLMSVSPKSLPGHLMRKADPFPDRGRSLDALRARGVRVVGRLGAAEGRSARFDDGTSVEVDTVIWCVGYRDDLAWLDIAGATDGRGAPVLEDGASPIPGLYFIGRPWQRNRASALVLGAGDDAGKIIESVQGIRSR
jgi:putative flavoprotein involved in K+ transport